MTHGHSRQETGGMFAGVLRAVWPALSLVLAVIVVASSGAVAWALVPVGVIFFWGIRRGARLSVLVVFACGLMLDALSHGPVGYWALVYLVALQLALTVAEFAQGGSVARTLMLALCLAVACVVQVGVMAAFGVEPANGAGMALGAGVVLAVYPALAWVLALGAGPAGMAEGLRFEPQVRS